MKKFVIISLILILLSTGVFGYSLYNYIEVTRPAEETPADTWTPATADEPTELTLNRASLDDDGIFSEYYSRAQAYVSNMSKEQMIGQMLLGIVSDVDTASTDVKRYALGGVLFDSVAFDYKSQDEVKEAIASVGESALTAPILAAQEEGGLINTVSDHDAFYDVSFDSPRNIYENGGIAEVERTEDEKAQFLADLGFNLNLAPVVDLPNNYNQIMYSRSLCGDAQTTSVYAEYVAKFNQAKGVSVALKHFPGYGTIPDTIDSVVIDDRAADDIRALDYMPFKAGAAAGAHFIMISNVVVQNIDEYHTAALSTTLHRELRENVGFTGLIMTDVIDRADYSAYADGNSVAVTAVLAGNDVILVRDYGTAYNAILAALNNGTIDPAIIQQACTRVIAYKYAAGILE